MDLNQRIKALPRHSKAASRFYKSFLDRNFDTCLRGYVMIENTTKYVMNENKSNGWLVLKDFILLSLRYLY